MRDYAGLIEALRRCSCDEHHNCPIHIESDEGCENCNPTGLALNAIEDLQNQLRDVTKMILNWISVENPPKDDRNIFICHGQPDFKAPCIGHYDPVMKRFYEDRNWFASPIYDAMFWCEMPKLPLPAPPKEVLPNGDV